MYVVNEAAVVTLLNFHFVYAPMSGGFQGSIFDVLLHTIPDGSHRLTLGDFNVIIDPNLSKRET